MLQSTLHFAGADWTLEADEVAPGLLSDLEDCGASGDVSEAVAYVRRCYVVTGDPADCAAYLRGYGAWEDDELADHDTNLDRLVWLAGCSLHEGEAAYFSTY